MFQEGQQIGGYTLIKRIGRGGFGEVWLAERRTALLTTKVAVKLPHDSLVNLETVRKEAVLWEQASGHANVLPIIEANIYDGQIVFVSEYAPDGSLADLLKREGQISIEDAVRFTIGITAGLEFLHSRRIIHRDLKPANILLQGENPRLADFGISHALQTSVSSQSKNIKGTFSYMPPEAFDGKRNEQTDIWSIGVILYQMLRGSLPFPQENTTELIGALVRHDPEPLPKEIPAKLKELVAKCLAKLPENRYKSAKDLRLDLEKILVGISHPGFAVTEVLAKDDFETIKDVETETEIETDVSPKPVRETNEVVETIESEEPQPESETGKSIPSNVRHLVDKKLKKREPLQTFIAGVLVFFFLLLGAFTLYGIISNFIKTPEVSITIPKLIPYREGDKWGYVDKNKKIVIQPKYSSAFPFENGIAIVKVVYDYGLIDETGREITPIKYSGVNRFSDELAFVADSSDYPKISCGFIDRSGKFVIPLNYEAGRSFSEGLAEVKFNGKWGYIDKMGKKILPFIYEETNSFKDGFATVKINGEWKIIDKTGAIIRTIDCEYASSFNDGWALVKNKSGSSNFIDKNGKYLSPSSNFEDARFFSEGIATVKSGGSWGFIDKSGKQIISFKYQLSGNFSGGLAPVEQLNGKWGFIDKTDKIIIPFKYFQANSFENGLALVEIIQDKEFYINPDGMEYMDASEIYSSNNLSNNSSNTNDGKQPLTAQDYYKLGQNCPKEDYVCRLQHYNKAIELNSTFAAAFHSRGNAYNDKKDYDQAISDYTKSIEFNKIGLDLQYTYNNRGVAYYMKSDYQQAIKDYTQAIQSDVSYAQAYQNRGIAYSQIGQKWLAEADYKKNRELTNKSNSNQK